MEMIQLRQIEAICKSLHTLQMLKRFNIKKISLGTCIKFIQQGKSINSFNKVRKSTRNNGYVSNKEININIKIL